MSTAARPSGVVTFLFTDIEGSTRLWERDPEAMRVAVARHDALLGAAVAGRDGVVFKHVGDAVQAAFADPAAAVLAVVAAQRALAAEPWPQTGPIRVRMALHLGEAAPNAAGDYNQVPCLNRLSRLLSTGFGGQALLSDAVRRAVAATLPADVSLRDLGRHRLRDLLEPEQVWQLVLAGLPDTFPPLKSLEGFPTNLPRQPTALVGRERELAELAALLGDEAPERLLTLTGPGGVGKTRLALQAAADAIDQFPDGVFLVRLGDVANPELALPAIAQAIGVREGGGLDLEQSLLAYLGEKRLLLVLDNFEQILEAAPDVAMLLEGCRNLQILATSRTPLRVAAERLVEVPPLGVPPARERDLDRLTDAPGVRLFAQRAAGRSQGFDLTAENALAVAEIVRRLDGLPLAVELAAAQTRFYSPAELLAELDERFRLLTGGDPSLLSHQQALETTIAWSYDRLAASERRLLARLSVFMGGWTREAARVVATAPGDDERAVDDGMRALTEASLIRREVDAADGSRWSMLESIRVFAADRLVEARERAALAERHATWCLAVAAEARPGLDGPDQERWLARLEAEHDNMRAALAATSPGPAGSARRLDLVNHLWRFWRVRGYLTEGRRWLENALQSAPQAPTPAARIEAMNGAGSLALEQGDYGRAREWFERGLATARATGDRAREAAFLNNLGAVALSVGELAEAEIQFRACLALSEKLGDAGRRADAQANLGALAHFRGDVPRAMAYYGECLRYWRSLGDLRSVAEMLLNLLLLLSPYAEHRDRARAFGAEALRRYESLNARAGMGLTLTGLGIIAQTAGEPDEAADLHRRGLAIFQEIEDRGNEARALGNLGLAELDRGRRAEAIARLGAALRLFDELGELDGIALSLEGVAAAVVADDAARAARLLGAARRLRDKTGMNVPPECRQRHQATLAQCRGRLGPAFAQAWDEGRAMPLADAVAAALADCASPRPNSSQPAQAGDDCLDDLLNDLS